MNRVSFLVRGWREIAYWGACFALAVCLHAAGAAAMLVSWQQSADAVASAPAILIDLAPLPVAPQTQSTDLPPGPLQAETETMPEPVVREQPKIDPAPRPEVVMSPTPPEKPKEKKQRDKIASLPSAPSPAERQAERAAAPMPGATSGNAAAIPNWKSLLVAQLERNKRYPPEARSRGEHGVAQLAFSVDRQGGVHNARVIHSSGSAALDAETLAMVLRAQPLPPPPPELAGGQIPVVVPIRYHIR